MRAMSAGCATVPCPPAAQPGRAALCCTGSNTHRYNIVHIYSDRYYGYKDIYLIVNILQKLNISPALRGYWLARLLAGVCIYVRAQLSAL